MCKKKCLKKYLKSRILAIHCSPIDPLGQNKKLKKLKFWPNKLKKSYMIHIEHRSSSCGRRRCSSCGRRKSSSCGRRRSSSCGRRKRSSRGRRYSSCTWWRYSSCIIYETWK